ncbi:hypothetical protein AB0D94_22580 [Streptomyces sp. NPDC048255]
MTWNPPGLSRTYVEDLMHRIAQHPTDSDPDMDEALRRVREGW